MTLINEKRLNNEQRKNKSDDRIEKGIIFGTSKQAFLKVIVSVVMVLRISLV
ncbi:hypothetical protein [Helicobacter cetorum]|uniref:hypothetical protein n=1 Tax=Helicobacter cetorum TaxID=138563 RepID=UPI0003011A25|nr:hypothetical protein [Helicobacter cetorum]